MTWYGFQKAVLDYFLALSSDTVEFNCGFAQPHIEWTDVSDTELLT